MRLNNCLTLCISFLLISFSTVTKAADPMLNGISIHSELGKEQFIGALYSNPLSDNADTLASSSQAMRMELKIVSPEGMTTRRFSRMWIEGMAINNGSALLTEQADNMVKFDGLFKGKFLENDHIIFSYEPTKGVNIVVNNTLLGNIPSEKFFGMLLKTWIGKVALSSEYKDGILKVGNVNPELKTRFASIKPSKERSTDVATWSKLKTEAQLAEEKAKESKSSSSQASSQESAKQIAQQKAEALKAEAAAKAEAAKLAAQAKAQEADEKPALTAQTLLARQFYISDALKKVFTNARYPKRELEKGISGRVRVAVVIDRSGNIVSTSLLDSSEYEDFNDAALKAITKTAPFPALPDAITGQTFEFSVPISFVLPK